jgi:hypothetical protein
MAVDEKNLEERKVRALEDIASSFRDLNDWMFELNGTYMNFTLF